MSPVYNRKIVPFSMQDEYGTVDVYMLPFIKPAHVRRFCDDEITTYTDAINSVISKLSINHDNRNILVTHQFVTGSLRSESEEISVGGSDNVDAYVFDPFDYVALGHIHSPQNCGAEHIRYCGTPLKYSFSEAKDRKSVTVIELAEKGKVSYKTIDLVPQHDLVELKGTYDELTFRSFWFNVNSWGRTKEDLRRRSMWRATCSFFLGVMRHNAGFCCGNERSYACRSKRVSRLWFCCYSPRYSR